MKKYLILVLAAVSLTACSDFLEENPRSFISPSVIENEADIENGLAGILGAYAGHPEYYARNFMILAEGSVDLMNITSAGERAAIDQAAFQPDNTVILGPWTVMWSVIANANNLIAGIENASQITEEQRSNYAAATRFTRAYTYFDLVRTFNGVPLITGPVTDADQVSDATRASGLEVLEFVKTELEQIRDMYSEDWNAAHTFDGWPSKWEAKALLTYVYMMLSGVEYNQNYWAEAAAEARDIIDNGPFDLVDYAELFLAQNKNNQECIFSLQGHANIITLSFRPNGTGNQAGWGTFNTNPGVINLWDDADLRKAPTFLTEVENVREDGSIGNPPSWDYTKFPGAVPYIAKYTSSSRDDKDWFQQSRRSGTNIIVFRLADVLLMHAEAENELNGPAGAESSLNRVRTRAGLPALNGLSQDEFREAVREERTLELAFELKRRFDLIRWGTFYDVMLNDPKAGPNIQPYHKYFPIPQADFDLLPLLDGQDGYDQQRTTGE